MARSWSVNVTTQRHRPVRILVCDDFPVYRLGLGAVFSQVADMDLVGECSDPFLVWTERLRTCPDVLVLAERLSSTELNIIRHFNSDGIGVVIVGESDQQAVMADALRAGARAYLRRDTCTEPLLAAIRAASRHEVVQPVGAGEQVLHPATTFPREPAPPHSHVSPPIRGLTARQREVARLVADGLSNAEVASQLYVSQATVKSHLTIILKRLNMRDRTQLAILLNRTSQIDAAPTAWT